MTKRSAAAAANLYRNRNKALAAVPLGIAAGYLIGIPTSFMRRRGSLPWEPMDIIVIGTIWAVVITIFTVLVLVMMQRYVSLYNSGTEVPGQVVAEHMRAGVRGIVVAFSDASGQPRYSWVVNSPLAVGQSTTIILGPAGSKLVLVHALAEGYARASALTQEQIATFSSGPS